MSYRNDIEALAARTAALEDEVRAKTHERDVAARLLDDARARANRPVLDNIRIATPCTADWNQMIGDDRVRLCATCNKHVYNLSQMTREDAEALITAKEGKLCARYFQRSDGTILLADCEIGRKQKQKRRLVAFGAAALLAGGGVIAYKLTRPTPREQELPIAYAGGASFEAPPPPPHQAQQTHPDDVTAIAGGLSFDAPPPPLEIKHPVKAPKAVGKHSR